jgi:L-asparaginase
MSRPRLLVLTLGGTISMVPDSGGGLAPRLGAAELLAAVPALAEVAEIEAHSLLGLPSPSLGKNHLVEVARRIEAAFGQEPGFDGAVVVQGTDTIEESAFILDLLVPGDRPVVVTGAMRPASAPGADGPANLLAAAQVAAAPAARGLGTLVVLNDEIHAARHVHKGHTALPSAFLSPNGGPIGLVAEGRVRIWARPPRLPSLPSQGGPPRPVALLPVALGGDGRMVEAVEGLGYAGLVLEGMGAGHVPAEVAPLLGHLAQRLPVVLASRCLAGPVFTHSYGYPGGEIDLLGRGLIPAGTLSGPKARLLLGLVLRDGGCSAAAAAFAPYQ